MEKFNISFIIVMIIASIILIWVAYIYNIGITEKINQEKQFNESLQELSCDELNNEVQKYYFSKEGWKMKMVISEISQDKCKITIPIAMEKP